jgi:type II secretory pathway pseudopilin PulG
MLVVILIVGILIGGGATFLISLFNASARSFQSFQQQTTLQQATGFISSRLNAMTSSDDIGTTINTGSVNAGIGITVNCSTSPADCINPLSVAGDQLVFQSQGTCYRLYYIQSSQQLDVASDAPISGSCTGTPIDPVRGPNEIAPEACGAANYDPVLDDPSDTSNSCVSGLPESYTVAQLAGDITATAPSHGAPTTGVCGTGSPPSSYPTLQVFTYCNGGLSAAGQPNSSLDPPDVAAMGAATGTTVVALPSVTAPTTITQLVHPQQ